MSVREKIFAFAEKTISCNLVTLGFDLHFQPFYRALGEHR